MIFNMVICVEKEIATLSEKTKLSDSLWQQLKEFQGQFVGKLSEIQRLRQFLNQGQPNVNGISKADQQQLERCKKFKEEISKQAGMIYQNLVETRKNILLTLKQCSDQSIAIRKELVDNVLLEWKKAQKLAQIGLPFEKQNESLDRISLQFENLAEELWQLRTYCSLFNENLDQAPNLPDNNVQLCQSVLTPIAQVFSRELAALVRDSFIVARQPSVVLKQHNKFTAETRLLIGEKLGVRFLNIKVGIKLISEEHARALKDGTLDISTASSVAKIGMSDANGSQHDVHIEVEREGRRVKAVFKSRLLKVDPRKSGGKATDEQQQMLVCERNYALLFTCSPFVIGEIEFPCVWTLSLPVKITVHGSQERLSQAMILWDHAFAPADAPFCVPESVDWIQLSDALQSKFKIQTGTNRPLSKQDLDYLFEKLNGRPSADQNGKISLSKFCKDNMREDVDFSFWAWFFEIMVLIKQKLQRYWDDGFIKGFIGRQAASDLVLAQPQPTFLLRFSDTLLGGLSISFLALLEDGSREVLPLAPFTVKDLDHLSLAQRIAGCPSLQHIDVVCGSDGFYERQQLLARELHDLATKQRKDVSSTNHSYVVSELIMVLPSKSGSDLNVMSPGQRSSASPDYNTFMQEIMNNADTANPSPSASDTNCFLDVASTSNGYEGYEPIYFDINSLMKDDLRGLNLNVFENNDDVQML